MSTVETTVKSKITETTRSLADKLKAEITVDVTTGTVADQKSFFMDNLPEGVTPELVATYEGYKDTVVKAGGLALGEVSIDAMKANPELNRVTMTIPTVGKSYIGYAFDRSRQVPSRNDDGTTGTREKLGALTVDVVTYGTKNRGEFAAVKNELSEMALMGLSKK